MAVLINEHLKFGYVQSKEYGMVLGFLSTPYVDRPKISMKLKDGTVIQQSDPTLKRSKRKS